MADNFAFRREKLYQGYTVANFFETLEFLVNHGVLHRDSKNGRLRYHLMVYWQAEQKIKSGLLKLLKRQIPKNFHKFNPNISDINSDEEFSIDFSLDCFNRISTDKQQRLAAEKISKKDVVIISGRGGTGKTEVVTTVLSHIENLLESKHSENSVKDVHENTSNGENCNKDPSIIDNTQDGGQSREESEKKTQSNGRILYVAPTGKAASVMRKRAKKAAYTIHQVLFSYRSWLLQKFGESSKDGSTVVSEWKFAETRICAVDECSMVSVVLFSSLIECLQKASCLTKVVLLGDVLQLPSIDPGNFMEDLFNAFRPEGLALELETNHRSEGSLIFENARRYK